MVCTYLATDEYLRLIPFSPPLPPRLDDEHSVKHHNSSSPRLPSDEYGHFIHSLLSSSRLTSDVRNGMRSKIKPNTRVASSTLPLPPLPPLSSFPSPRPRLQVTRASTSLARSSRKEAYVFHSHPLSSHIRRLDVDTMPYQPPVCLPPSIRLLVPACHSAHPKLPTSATPVTSTAPTQ
ncbi:hypothetical protein BDQ17DRAFT_1541588 [Cyathus striatus]|nr:hypothetical protein BDQ17DRAFT_1541588 [Cyathus striatus]